MLPDDARSVKELGDGLMLWFPDACSAISTCIELQLQIEDEGTDRDFPLWLRMGAHWGRQTVRRDDFVGHDVNVAARIVEMAAPREVLGERGHLERGRRCRRGRRVRRGRARPDEGPARAGLALPRRVARPTHSAFARWATRQAHHHIGSWNGRRIHAPHDAASCGAPASTAILMFPG